MPKQKANNIDTCIGRNLEIQRTAKGLSREDLGGALKTPISSQAVIKYEDGSTRIPAASLVELAWVLGCKLEDLFRGVSELLPKNRPAPAHQQHAVANLTKAMSIELSERYSL